MSILFLKGQLDFVRKQLKDLGNHYSKLTQTVFTSPKIGKQLKIQKRKPLAISRHCVVYQLKFYLSNTDYIAYCYLSSSCPMAHRAFMESFHFSLTAATTRTSSQEPQPPSLISLSTVLLQVVFGLPRLLLPSGAHDIATLQLFSQSCLRICPIIFHLLDLTSLLSGFI